MNQDLEQSRKQALDAMLAQADKQPAPELAAETPRPADGVRVEPILPGANLPEPTVSKFEVSQGSDGVFSSFELSYPGTLPSQFHAYLDPESLKIDRLVKGEDTFPVAHGPSVDQQIQQHCKELGVEPLIKLEAAQEWVSETIGGDFEILKSKRGVQLQGAGGIWTSQESIKAVFDRIENHLLDDLHFLKDAGKAMGYPDNLKNDRGVLDYRHSAYVRSKIEAAMEKRPDEISKSFPLINSRNFEESAKKVTIKL